MSSRSSTYNRAGSRNSFVYGYTETPPLPPTTGRHYSNASELAPISLRDLPPAPEGSPSISRTATFNEPCCVCKLTIRTYVCVQCNNDAFCDKHWDEERPHRPGAVGFDGLPHEKTDRNVVKRLRDILESTRTAEEQQIEHKNDEDTTWFGIARDPANLPIFQDYGRYAKIMAESQTVEVNIRTPQLISFVGQTGAGKSTLIKMLIENQESGATSRPGASRFSSPVTGAANDNLPTSGDVHLYSDPATYYSSRPILYADCEGLDGGENVPRGARYTKKDSTTSTTNLGRTPQTDDASFRKKVRKAAHSHQRDIAWATNPETRKREYAVTQLYPRILYTFSDVVVFVLRNSKVFESIVLEKLLDWASASIEKSLNQPALPHVIIALNASEITPSNQQWDVKRATETLMADIEGAINRVPRLEEYAQFWRSRGKTVESTKALLECYYSSITVVRIPTRGRYMLMDEQLRKLNSEILRCCESSYRTKRRVRMLATGEQLQVYLQSAFDHFSQNLDTPFDFVKEAIKINPIPRDFRGNILKLAIAIRDNGRLTQIGDGPRIFHELSVMVASCVMLDFVRHGLPGTAAQLLEDYYVDPCDEALDDFCDMYWPCMFRDKNNRCALTKSGHTKGHQNAEGKILAAGEYITNFRADEFSETWIRALKHHLEGIEKKLSELKFKREKITELEIASQLHRDNLNEFFSSLGGASRFVSHTTCYCCLRELPEHPLPCGHILCSPCVEQYGERHDKTVIQLESCPLHRYDTRMIPPWEIKVKPRHAGVRVLCLDGGGVRGIVELEVLKAIERALGGNLRIQSFFDLIIGTSTGGIVALGLGVQDWTVDYCTRMFTEVCEQAFTGRVFHNIPMLGHFSTFVKKSKYKTRPFEKTLQDTFSSDKPLFGGQDVGEASKVKVALTSTTTIDQSPVVMTNYNRPEPPEYSTYRFERYDDPRLEMRIWEAARATSAAPPYFKQFIKHETKYGYIDGGLYHNNPVHIAHHESKLIWSDVNSRRPDIFLSVGTGHNGPGPDENVRSPREAQGLFARRFANGEDESRPTMLTRNSNPKKVPNFTEQLWDIASTRFSHLLNCDRIWKTFRTDNFEPDSVDLRRYIRINPDLKFPVPKLDEVKELSKLQNAAATAMKHHTKVREVAHRLVASTFFFEKVDSSTKEFDGSISCRFRSGSEEMKNFGRYLYKHLTHTFTPYFVIREDGKPDSSHMVPISEQCLTSMCVRGGFNLKQITVTVAKQLSEVTIALCLQEGRYATGEADLPISGFPRALMSEDIVRNPSSRSSMGGHSGTGSLKRRELRRRRRGLNNPMSMSDSAIPTLRRVKSQSDLKVNEMYTPVEMGPGGEHSLYASVSADQSQSQSRYPEGPDSVRRWLNRSNSIDSIRKDTEFSRASNYRNSHAVAANAANASIGNGSGNGPVVFELADTSFVAHEKDDELYDPPVRRKFTRGLRARAD